jgi:hypothetical protein
MNADLSSAAKRMRRSRARRKLGATVVTFPVGADVIDQLVSLGWLDEAARADGEWVTDAIIRLATQAIALRVSSGEIAERDKRNP